VIANLEELVHELNARTRALRRELEQLARRVDMITRYLERRERAAFESAARAVEALFDQ